MSINRDSLNAASKDDLADFLSKDQCEIDSYLFPFEVYFDLNNYRLFKVSNCIFEKGLCLGLRGKPEISPYNYHFGEIEVAGTGLVIYATPWEKVRTKLFFDSIISVSVRVELDNIDVDISEADILGSSKFLSRSGDVRLRIFDSNLKDFWFSNIRKEYMRGEEHDDPAKPSTLVLSGVHATDFVSVDSCNLSHLGLHEIQTPKLKVEYCRIDQFESRGSYVDSLRYIHNEINFRDRISASFLRDIIKDKYIENQFKVMEFELIRTDAWKSKRFIEWIQLTLNKITNNYGNDWFRGLLFVAVVSVLGFFNYAFFYDGHLHLDLSITGFTYIWNEYGGFFWNIFFLNKKLLENGEPQNPFTCGMILFLTRILIVYGSYQIAQAFRRFGKL